MRAWALNVGDLRAVGRRKWAEGALGRCMERPDGMCRFVDERAHAIIIN